MFLVMIAGLACSSKQAPSTPTVESSVPLNVPVEESKTTEESCCCWHQDAAGAGLDRFSSDKGACDGHYTMLGCVDSALCEVTSMDTVLLSSVQLQDNRSKERYNIQADPTQVHYFSTESRGFSVIYYPSPLSDVLAQWKQELAVQQFTLLESEGAVEAHGQVYFFERTASDKKYSLQVDFEEKCQASEGTCVWVAARPCGEAFETCD